MPRKPRIHYEGAIYHVILRGNNRQRIFFNDAHRNKFYNLLADVIKKYNCKIHVFCLMSNHIHIMIQVKQIPLSKIMQSLASRYANWLHRQIRHVGHLFQGRFKAFLIDHESYMLELCRYIHLNPVRAKMVAYAKQYRWSSHRCYLGLDNLPWLTTEYVKQILADNFSDKGWDYGDFIKQNVDYEFKPSLDVKEDGEIVIRDKVQKESNENYTNCGFSPIFFNNIVKIVCRELSVNISELGLPGKSRKTAKARALISMYAQDYCRMKLADLTEALGRSTTTLGNAVSMIRKRRLYSKNTTIFARIEQELMKSGNRYA